MIIRGRCAVAVIAMVIILAACGLATRRERPKKLTGDQLRAMAESYLTAGDIGLALQYLMQADEKKPNDPLIHYDFGLAYGARGLSDEAIFHFKKAIALKPRYPEAYNALGAAYARQGNYAKAEKALKKALADPLYQTPHYALFNLGLLHEKEGDLEAALEDYRKAVQIKPAYGAAYFRMGKIEERLGRPQEALWDYERAVRYAPNMPEALLRAGILNYEAGNQKKARDYLIRVVNLDPTSELAVEARQYLDKLPKSSGKI